METNIKALMLDNSVKMFIFNVKPVGKPRMTRSDKWKGRACVKRYFDFKDEMRARAEELNFELASGLHYFFYLPMPDSWSEAKKKEHVNKGCTSKPDLDNLIKAVWDSLAKEDKNITSIGEAHKIWSYRPKIIIIRSNDD